MIKRKEKIGNNIQHNFKNSPEINSWSILYNTPVDKIHQIFESTGNSIAKTIAILRTKEQTA